MLKLIFLGVNGSVQEKTSGNTSLIVKKGNCCIAVDLSCHIDAVVEAEPDVVFMTHEHIDHVYGLPSLLHQSWLVGRTKPMRIVCPEGLKNLINSMIDLFSIRQKKNIFPISVSSEDNFSAGDIDCLVFPTDHSAASSGIIFRDTKDGDKIIYTCDTRPMMDKIANNAEMQREFYSPRVLIHESSGTSDNEETLVKKGHSSGKDAALLAGYISAEKLLLCHLPVGDAAKAAVVEEAKTCFPASFIPAVLEEIQ